jgi:dienelactone hydrolase
VTIESAETLADRRKVEEGYALVNAMWKTQGAAAVLRYVHHLPHGRALPLGLDLAELDRVIASVDSFYRGGHRDWPTQWFKAGDAYLERGRKALTSGHRQTAAQMLLSAAVCHHLAGYMHHDIGRLLPETKQSMLRAVEIYWEAAPLFSPRSALAEVPFDDTTLRPFLRLPRNVERPPCVILIGGANSNMINMHAVSDYYLDRGMATIGLDGPGQGEFRARTGRALRVGEYDRALGAVADWVQRDGRLDGTRIGIYGRATGSLLAIHDIASAGDVQLSRRQDAGGGDASCPRAAHARRRGGSRGFPDLVGMLGRRRDDAHDGVRDPATARQGSGRDRHISRQGPWRSFAAFSSVGSGLDAGSTSRLTAVFLPPPPTRHE